MLDLPGRFDSSVDQRLIDILRRVEVVAREQGIDYFCAGAWRAK
jgi:hypothetical protein